MTTFAKVTVTVEIDCGQGWNDETSSSELRRSALRVAEGKMRGVYEQTNRAVKMIGKPVVKAIWYEMPPEEPKDPSP